MIRLNDVKMIWSLREKYKMGEPSAIQIIDELARKEGLISGIELIERVESQMKNLVEAVSQMSINMNNSLALFTQPIKNMVNSFASVYRLDYNFIRNVDIALSGLRQASYDYHNLPTAQFLEKYPNFEKELALSYIVEDPMILRELDIPEVREFLGPIVYDQLILKNEYISREFTSDKATRQKPEEPSLPNHPPTEPPQGADLHEWFDYYHAMNAGPYKCTLGQIAKKSGYSLGTLKNYHAKYKIDKENEKNDL